MIAKGARKGGSRLAGSSEPLVRARFTWALGKARRYIVAVNPITSFPGLRSDYERLTAGLALAEAISEVLPFESPSQEVFDLTVAALENLASSIPPDHTLCWALALLLREEGLEPDWETCAICGSASKTDPSAIALHLGQRVCANCAQSRSDIYWIPYQALVALMRLPDLEGPPETFRDSQLVLKTLCRNWQSHLERPLKALQNYVRESDLLRE